MPILASSNLPVDEFKTTAVFPPLEYVGKFGNSFVTASNLFFIVFALFDF